METRVLTPWEIEVAARTVWGEARGYPPTDDLGVAFVIINRHRSKFWYAGLNLADTCLMPYQFSCWNLHDPNRRKMICLEAGDPLFDKYRKMIVDAWRGEVADPTYGATHYYAPAGVKAPPSWVEGAEFTVRLGPHCFYRNVA